MTGKQKTATSAAKKRTSGTDMPWCANPIVEWLLTSGLDIPSTGELLEAMCCRLAADGLPLLRMYCLIQTLHPQVFAISYTWRRDNDGIEKFSAPHELLKSSLHLDSPCAAIFDGAYGIRRRLDIADPLLDFPVLEDLYAEGATDYVAMPLQFSDGQVNLFSVTADRPGGFDIQDLELIHGMLPVLSLQIEVQEMRRTAGTLLNTYLGRQSGEKVLSGFIKRGDGEDIFAVILFSDLRDSTALADSMERDAFLRLLNDFFDCVAGAVLDQGGEVLRFIGDAALAIFPVNAQGSTSIDKNVTAACQSAMEAATNARAKLLVVNEERIGRGERQINFGLALHLGNVMYGNIGVPKRLEFTVVGAAANEAARLEDMCKVFGKPILASGNFAQYFPGKLVSLGVRKLRGVNHELEVFAPPDDERADSLD